MERVRINPFAAITAIWRDKPDVELDGEQEEVIAKLAPREAIELNKSLKRADGMAGKLSLEKTKNDFKNSNKVEKSTSTKRVSIKSKEIEIDDEEITK